MDQERSQIQAYGRWQNLLDGATWLEDELKQHPAKRETGTDLAAACAYLERILADFPEPRDPKEDPEGYAVHRMALSLRKALVRERLSSDESTLSTC